VHELTKSIIDTNDRLSNDPVSNRCVGIDGRAVQQTGTVGPQLRIDELQYCTFELLVGEVSAARVAISAPALLADIGPQSARAKPLHVTSRSIIRAHGRLVLHQACTI